MTYEIRQFTVTIPAGTAVAAGFAASLALPPRIVTEIHVRIPPGPRGEVGFQIGSGGLQIIPVLSGGYVVTDDEDLIFPLDSAITSGAWQLLGYNTGNYDHTLRISFYCDLIADASSSGSGSGSVIGVTGTTGGGGDGTGGGSPPPVLPPPVLPPPVTPPPTLPPPTGSPAPVLLPPSINIPPSLGGPVLPADPDTVLVGVADLSQVWLLDTGGYHQIPDQDTVTALTSAGIEGVAVSSGMHQNLLAASSQEITVEIGPEILSGWWQAVSRGGVAPTHV